MKYLALPAAAIGLAVLSNTAEAGGCDMSTVKGTFAEQASGFTGTGTFMPFVASGIRVFDGAGNYTGYGYHVTGGAAAAKFTGTGTYNVGPDCTIVSTGTPSDQFGVIKDFGNTISAIRTNAGLTLTIIYTRIAP